MEPFQTVVQKIGTVTIRDDSLRLRESSENPIAGNGLIAMRSRRCNDAADKRVKRTQLRAAYRLLVVLAGSAFVTVMIAVSLAQRGSVATGEPVIPGGVAVNQWANNGQSGQYVLQSLDGAVPTVGGTLSSAFISDAHCAPDARGLSHCHNVIAFHGGDRVTVVNTHLMKRHSCLRPGESVELTRINDSWATANLL